jgi:hypothetical protein
MKRELRAFAAQNQLLASRIAALENLVVTSRIPPEWIADPAPDGGGLGGGIFGGGGVLGGGIGPIADPSPEDLGKLGKVQIESRLADIQHMRVQLESVEKLLKTEMDRF